MTTRKSSSKKTTARKSTKKATASKKSNRTAVSKAVRNFLLSGVAAEAGVKEAEAVLQEKREGMYVMGVKAAIAAESPELFTEVVEKLESDFRANRYGLADKYNVAQAKKPKSGELKFDDKGNPIYTVPGSLRTMKAYVLKAFRLLPFSDFGTAAKPTSFNALRTLCRIAEEERAKAEQTPDDKARAVVEEAIDALKPRLANVSGAAAFKAALALVQEVGQALDNMAA